MNTISAVKVNFMLPLWKLPGLVPLPFFFLFFILFSVKEMQTALEGDDAIEWESLGQAAKTMSSNWDYSQSD